MIKGALVALVVALLLLWLAARASRPPGAAVSMGAELIGPRSQGEGE